MASDRPTGYRLAQAIAEGATAQREARAQFTAAIAAREPEVGAFVHLDIDAAYPAAPGPLAGLPVGIKDIIDTAGMPTQCGSAIYKGRVAMGDAPIVSMIRRAGGVILGKTTTTEFAHATPTATRNPHNLDHTPGGSSAGSAAAVAAGFVPFAVGTQTGGSVIRPAAFCGVAGFKPSFDLLPTAGVKALSWSLDTVGLFAPTVRDVAFFAQAITGRQLAVTLPDGWHPRIGVVDMQAVRDASPAIRRALAQAGEAAARRGAVVTPVALGEAFETAQAAQVIIQEYEGARCLAWEYETHPDLLSPQLYAAMTAAQDIPTAHYLAALDAGRRARAELARVFETVDVLLLPSAPGAAPQGLGSTGSAILNRLWSLIGVPSVNVPGQFDGKGLPLGLQVIAPFGGDALALRAAAYLEEC
jgi:Asp-tRNA(Asn)/Glu-tRNA(Gln) amidotransferase A subunit family amidase